MAGASYKVSIVTPSAVGANAAAAVVRAAGSNRPRISRAKIVVQASPVAGAVVDVYRIPANNGSASNGTTVLGQGMQSEDTSTTTVETVWSSQPMLPSPAVRIDGVSLSGAIGSGDVLTFADMTLEANTGLLFWCPIAGAQFRISFDWTE